MKKIISIGKVLLLTILFVFGSANRCFADVYVNPTEGFIGYNPVLEFILIILGVIFVISLVCMLVAKINKSEELLSKSKKIFENLLYYILFIVGLVASNFAMALIYILGTIPLIIVFVSLFLRLKRKKKASYIVLGIFYGYVLFLVTILIILYYPYM